MYLLELLRKGFFELLCAYAECEQVLVAAVGAGARYTLGVGAVVAAQAAVAFVEDAVGAAVGAFAFPAAFFAV